MKIRNLIILLLSIFPKLYSCSTVKSTSILTCAAVAGALLCYLKCIDIYVLSASVKQFIVKKPDKFFMGKPSQNRGGATNSIMGYKTVNW